MPEHIDVPPTKSLKGDTLPAVSFLLPTLNAAKYLERCLESIFSQDYPRDKIEVLVADGGSSDSTLAIAQKYPVTVLENPRVIAEDGKYIALQQSVGEMIVLIDADNVIASTDWLSKMVVPLVEHADVECVESNYLVAKDFSSINTYATLLVIADPIARLIASRAVATETFGNYIVKTFSKGSAPVAGANGFIWRRSLLDRYLLDTEQLNETNLLWKIVQEQKLKIANIPGTGIYHYYCISFGDYIRKRNKIAHKFLKRQKSQRTWVDSRGKLLVLLAAIYSFSLVGPLLEAIWMALRQQHVSWLWHPVASYCTAALYAASFFRGKLKSDEGR